MTTENIISGFCEDIRDLRKTNLKTAYKKCMFIDWRKVKSEKKIRNKIN